MDAESTSITSKAKKKRINTHTPARKSCFHCKSSHNCCSNSRPCHRCVAKGLDCYDIPSSRKKPRYQKTLGDMYIVFEVEPPKTQSQSPTSSSDSTENIISSSSVNNLSTNIDKHLQTPLKLYHQQTFEQERELQNLKNQLTSQQQLITSLTKFAYQRHALLSRTLPTTFDKIMLSMVGCLSVPVLVVQPKITNVLYCNTAYQKLFFSTFKMKNTEEGGNLNIVDFRGSGKDMLDLYPPSVRPMAQLVMTQYFDMCIAKRINVIKGTNILLDSHGRHLYVQMTAHLEPDFVWMEVVPICVLQPNTVILDNSITIDETNYPANLQDVDLSVMVAKFCKIAEAVTTRPLLEPPKNSSPLDTSISTSTPTSSSSATTLPVGQM